MHLMGKCSFCGTVGDWEGGIWDTPVSRSRNDTGPHDRPVDWAALFPTKRIIPRWRVLNWGSPKFCEEHDILTALACPNCCREPLTKEQIVELEEVLRDELSD